MPIALIAGSTGLVGSHLLKILLGHDFFKQVVAIGRRPPLASHNKLEFIKVDFNELDRVRLPDSSHVFCCLGTTMKQAGSKRAFIKVDLEYPLHLASAAIKTGAGHFYLVSSVGANKSSMFFYSQVKGQLEEAIANMQFSSIRIFRPSLLLGKRTEKRMGEKIGAFILRIVSPLMIGKLNKYRGIEAETVALSMYASAIRDGQDVEVLEPEEIRALAATI